MRKRFKKFLADFEDMLEIEQKDNSPTGSYKTPNQ